MAEGGGSSEASRTGTGGSGGDPILLDGEFDSTGFFTNEPPTFASNELEWAIAHRSVRLSVGVDDATGGLFLSGLDDLRAGVAHLGSPARLFELLGPDGEVLLDLSQG